MQFHCIQTSLDRERIYIKDHLSHISNNFTPGGENTVQGSTEK